MSPRQVAYLGRRIVESLMEQASLWATESPLLVKAPTFTLLLFTLHSFCLYQKYTGYM
jgi:hypothetical protein